jgi:uroporphyrinogen-III synthase
VVRPAAEPALATHRSAAAAAGNRGRQRTHRLPELLPQADIVIAVSMHAVHFTHHFLLQTGQTWPHIDYFAVGQASADAFAEVGIQALSPDDPRSEGLLALPACKG